MKIGAEALSLTRGGRTLFAPQSFAVGNGEFVEVRGANGAGKTSLLRALLGWIRPSEGRVVFEGAEEPDLAIAYLGHRDGLKAILSARAHAAHWADLLGGDAGFVEGALARCGLTGISDLQARVLSQGQKRRLALTRLLVAPRPIWILDEPAAALDANGKALVASLVSEKRAGGGIVIAAAHEPIGPAPDHVLEIA